jgi:hypothetical protein
LPILALRERGISSSIFDSDLAGNLTDIDVLVIVKSFKSEDIALAYAAVEKNIPIIFDICDNVFVDGYGSGLTISPEDALRQIAMVASAFVTPTETLADIVRVQLGSSVPVYVVPDGIETAELNLVNCDEIQRAQKAARRRKLILNVRAARLFRRLIELLRTETLKGAAYRLTKFVYRNLEQKRLRMLSLALNRFRERVQKPVAVLNRAVVRSKNSSNAKRLLWYGNYGNEHYGRFGLTDLVDNRVALERIAVEFDVELVVISNSAAKFEQLIAPLSIRSRYVEWHPARVQEELVRADIVLVPNSCDEFSISKSANRTALALMANRPVVATLTPALRPLADCIETGDFYSGIRRYLTDPQHAAAHLAKALERCQQLYGQAAIANSWLELLDSLKLKAHKSKQKAVELIIVAHLVQDVEFICPIVERALEQGISLAIWVSTSMLRKWPYAYSLLAQTGSPLHVIAETGEGAVVPIFPSSVRAVLTIADTNLGPHRFSNSITQAANQSGILTGTLQHGFENVGLTYSDDLHVIERIKFAAKKIFLWGEISQLHPRVSEETRNRCIPVGYPKVPMVTSAALPPIVAIGKPIIGIFENLHWHRYDNAYRRFFIDGVSRLAADNPNLMFILKPHNAGRWLTTRFDGRLLNHKNLFVADPSDPQWEGITASGLIPHLSGVITSPSTVALDAALTGLPVAVVAKGLALEKYSPLFLIRNASQWFDFGASMFDVSRRRSLVAASNTFVGRVLVPGDAVASILENLLNPSSDDPNSIAGPNAF